MKEPQVKFVCKECNEELKGLTFEDCKAILREEIETGFIDKVSGMSDDMLVAILVPVRFNPFGNWQCPNCGIFYTAYQLIGQLLSESYRVKDE